MDTNVIVRALKVVGYSVKDVLHIADSQDGELKGKVYLKRGKGCLFLEGWESEVRRKRQKDGSLSFFRIQLDEPRWRVRLNDGSWTTIPDEE